MNDYKDVKNFIEKCRKNSQRIVLTHGVYDLFHVGHLHSLNKAKELGDILVVGIDSDWLVKIVKGEKRPIISEQDRMEIVKNLRCVDYAFILDTRSEDGEDRLRFFEDLYCYLKPDIVAVGKSEYWFNTQKKLCRSAGITFIATGEIKGSTTEIIKRIS